MSTTIFLPERQTGRCSLPTDKFHHAAGPATFAGAQGADPLGRRTGFYLRLAPTGGSSVPAPWSKPGPGHGNPTGPIPGARACHAQTGAATSGGRVSRHPGPNKIIIITPGSSRSTQTIEHARGVGGDARDDLYALRAGRLSKQAHPIS